MRSAFCITAVVVVSSACSSYKADPEISLATPPLENFGVLSSVLEPHCGTLDCHGSPGRNFRVYGKKGLRALGNVNTGAASDTNESDVQATYESMVSVEPEALSAVFLDHGLSPERFIVVAKARGIQHHVGGAPFAEGSAGDRCLVSWLAGSLDPTACASDVFGPMPRPGETW